MGICDVHYWAKGDEGIRKVYYCGACEAWVCEQCEWNIPLRAVAMAKRTKFEMLG